MLLGCSILIGCLNDPNFGHVPSQPNAVNAPAIGVPDWEASYQWDSVDPTISFRADAQRVDADGSIYVLFQATSAYRLVKFSSLGVLQWSYALAKTAPSMARQGQLIFDGLGNVIIYISSFNDNRLDKITPSGTLVWTKTIADVTLLDNDLALAAARSGDIYLLTPNTTAAPGALLAFNSDGSLRWRKDLPGDQVILSVLADSLGSIITCDRASIAKYSRLSGALIWQVAAQDLGSSLQRTQGACSLDAQDSLYVQSTLYYAGFVYGQTPSVTPTVFSYAATTKLNGDGLVQWEHKLPYFRTVNHVDGQGRSTGITVDSVGNVYRSARFYSADRALTYDIIYTIDRTGTQVAWRWSAVLPSSVSLKTSSGILVYSDLSAASARRAVAVNASDGSAIATLPGYTLLDNSANAIVFNQINNCATPSSCEYGFAIKKFINNSVPNAP